jgi:RNA-splicing ligase RtcB
MENLYFKGQYTDCVVFNDYVEESAIQQIYGFLNHPAFEGLKIRVQSDVHAGAGAVIGFTSTLGDKVVPNVIGVDIGCGVASLCVGKVDVNFQEVDDFIRSEIPSGFSVRGKPIKLSEAFIKEVSDVCKMTDQDAYRVLCSIGSLGGGNHFIEIGRDEQDFVWVTVHTGSRNFGLKIAQFHQAIAKKSNPFGDLSYLTGAEANAYFHDMKVAQKYAALNRTSILESIANKFWYGKKVDYAESVHNYVDFQHGIVRKGAISAQEGELVVIPWNMRDGLIIGVGRGNPEYNFSAPHGAGRVMGRMAAKRTLELEDFQKTMEGVWSSCVSQNTIDESPMAYKDYLQIENRLSETVEIKHKVKPLYNFKASE